MARQVLVEETHRPGGGDGEVQDCAVQDPGGVQGGHSEYCPQCCHLSRGAQWDGRPGQADVQRLLLRHLRDDHVQRLL